MKNNTSNKNKVPWWVYVIVIPLIPVILLIIPLILIFCLIYAVTLNTLIWTFWCTRGHNILFVYSNSPVWHDYIENNIIPYIRNRAVILNWSERKQWRWSLARLAFKFWGGKEEFNPIAIVFKPLRFTKTYRFWKPFRDWKHGRSDSLNEIEAAFFDSIKVKRHKIAQPS